VRVSPNPLNHEDLNQEKSQKYIIANPMERKEDYKGKFLYVYIFK
jgi:hypothetical protein